MWKVFQLSVVFAVMAANIHFGWTENGLAAGLVGGVFALFLTGCVVSWQEKSARRRLIRRQKLQDDPRAVVATGGKLLDAPQPFGSAHHQIGKRF